MNHGLVLIVNADDYGITPGVNRAIERAHGDGIVTSTSVMANQGATAEAAGLGDRCPRLGTGIHVTLTLGSPVADPGRVRTLVDRDGRLHPRPALVARARRGLVAAADVAAECTAQLSRLRELGLEPDHWDAHQHVQEHPQLGGPIAAAMAAAGVRRTRNPRRFPGGARIGLRALAEGLRARRRRRGEAIATAGHLAPAALLDAEPARWATLIPGLPDGVIEAICHPGEPEAELELLTPGLSAARADELIALRAPQLAAALVTRGVRLATFAEALGC
jgi:predicted glycoside hydrolase/deacetylase ChbG (UPF0249 family)